MKLETQWIVGFVEGTGCFHVSINPNLEARQSLLPEFSVVQHKKNVQILYALKTYFCCGVVQGDGNVMIYRVRNLNHLTKIIIPFFEKHLLKTKQRIAFQKFRTILLKMERKEYLTVEGFEKIKTLSKDLDANV
uniref:Putative site-specific DNA endonuclease n=1 Tax=Mesostigma viride TaxID=41882 RepID=Q8W9T6_MESVI|nr:putative site-specific DNA endonuclease [Mesostigma viride]AAL36722.1 putative site-specific DNA endonuclease [Mesostigma viride]